ncbi:DUF4435 domain-containing protein [Porphyromonadaceae bacterium OttesenSCG-928-L07]|nr:DUF4435 domain-containing protein [Porphyromonadaceae bacterium OttesenSCG-928-L07]MDL2251877.1 DUF4435 domain-containing protein [Odoribacter sp. OttesenSCG-928-J03]MDL2330566.1 DUF4435 domain-containing protein [Odoribacter sp. OttesenSCG-928-A06]
MNHEEVDKESRDRHFSSLARRFALDAKMLRCRAAIHVENKGDIIFWGAILKHFRPNERFHFISASRNEYGQDTSGVTQALKYYKFLSRDFFICIDSDYRYLTQERGINARNFILQTYTYSFENHLCYADGLDDVCERVTHLPNTIFSFKKFLTEYSYILYELFIWHLYFLSTDPAKFSKFEFNKYINLISHKRRFSIRNNGALALDELRIKVEKRTSYFGRNYPHADLDAVRDKYKKLGLTPATTYLFLRGHNIYDMMSCICKDVCKALLKQEEYNKKTHDAIAALYKERNNVDAQMHNNLKFGAYGAIKKIEEDLITLLDNL